MRDPSLFISYFPSSSFLYGKAFFKRLINKLKIQSVRIVPPIPTMIIVIPKVQLSISIHLLISYGEVVPERKDSPSGVICRKEKDQDAGGGLPKGEAPRREE